MICRFIFFFATLLMIESGHAKNLSLEFDDINIEGTYREIPERFTPRGPRCEDGCSQEKPSAHSTQVAPSKKKDASAEAKNAYENFLREAYQLFNLHLQGHSAAKAVELSLQKYFFDNVTKAAFSTTYTLFMIFRTTDLNKGSDQGTLIKEITPYFERLQNIRDREKKIDAKKIPPEKLPKNHNPGVFDPIKINEEKLRSSYLFRKPSNSKTEERTKIQNFLLLNEVAPYGKILSLLLDVYSKEAVSRDGLSQDAIEWLEEFGSFLETYQRRTEENSANTCFIPSDQKSCSIPRSRVGEGCYCNAAPGKFGFAKFQHYGQICESVNTLCSLPQASPFGSQCYCQGSYGIEPGRVRW